MSWRNYCPNSSTVVRPFLRVFLLDNLILLSLELGTFISLELLHRLFFLLTASRSEVFNFPLSSPAEYSRAKPALPQRSTRVSHEPTLRRCISISFVLEIFDGPKEIRERGGNGEKRW